MPVNIFGCLLKLLHNLGYIKLHIHNCMRILPQKSPFYIVMLFPKDWPSLILIAIEKIGAKQARRLTELIARVADITNYAEDVPNVLDASVTIIRKPFTTQEFAALCPYRI